jgi:hypothetical protein
VYCFYITIASIFGGVRLDGEASGGAAPMDESSRADASEGKSDAASEEGDMPSMVPAPEDEPMET